MEQVQSKAFNDFLERASEREARKRNISQHEVRERLYIKDEATGTTTPDQDTSLIIKGCSPCTSLIKEVPKPDTSLYKPFNRKVSKPLYKDPSSGSDIQTATPSKVATPPFNLEAKEMPKALPDVGEFRRVYLQVWDYSRRQHRAPWNLKFELTDSQGNSRGVFCEPKPFNKWVRSWRKRFEDRPDVLAWYEETATGLGADTTNILINDLSVRGRGTGTTLFEMETCALLFTDGKPSSAFLIYRNHKPYMIPLRKVDYKSHHKSASMYGYFNKSKNND